MPGFEDEESERVTSTVSKPFKEAKTETGEIGSKNGEEEIEVDPIKEMMRQLFEEGFKDEI